VDGAHGASAAFSHTHRARLKGIERADSVVWDAHKLMLSPALVTAVIFRDGRRSHEAFAQQASYLFANAESAAPPWYDIATRTLECTKLMLALRVWAILAVHGPKLLGDYVDGMFDLARRFAERLAAAPDFELAVAPECNIVCFRFRPSGAGGATGVALDELQSRVRKRIVESGRFYLVQVRLPAGQFLRVVLSNPFIRDEHLAELLDTVRATARAIAAAGG
jgi:L-2,4-diaminobutyrate decarboxylase